MAFRMDLWKVGRTGLQPIPPTTLDVEQRLEDWLAADPGLSGLDVLLVGRQVKTQHGGRIDLLALDGDANTVVFELKRGRTPREVVAQVLDYASWVRDLSFAELDSLCQGYTGKGLTTAYSERFDAPLPDTVNEEHTLVVVAAELDDSSERIVQYLGDRGIPINVVFFNLFRIGDQELVGRAWLRDPVELQEHAESRKKAPWTGYWFVNVGEGQHRTWEDNRKYGFIAAGQGEKYSKPLRKLQVGDRIFAYLKGHGYVGFGEVIEPAQPIRSVQLENGKSLLDHKLSAKRPDEHADDPRLSEWVARVRWLKAFPKDDARTFNGIFANQHIVCKLRDPETLQFVEREFQVES